MPHTVVADCSVTDFRPELTNSTPQARSGIDCPAALLRYVLSCASALGSRNGWLWGVGQERAVARRQFIGWRGKAETSMVATALDPVRACSWPTSSTRNSRRGGMLSAVTTALQQVDPACACAACVCGSSAAGAAGGGWNLTSRAGATCIIKCFGDGRSLGCAQAAHLLIELEVLSKTTPDLTALAATGSGRRRLHTLSRGFRAGDVVHPAPFS